MRLAAEHDPEDDEEHRDGGSAEDEHLVPVEFREFYEAHSLVGIGASAAHLERTTWVEVTDEQYGDYDVVSVVSRADVLVRCIPR